MTPRTGYAGPQMVDGLLDSGTRFSGKITTGRDQNQMAVRKAEARSPEAAPPSKVAANSTGQVQATARPKATDRLGPERSQRA